MTVTTSAYQMIKTLLQTEYIQC